jgi:hypothetical protein
VPYEIGSPDRRGALMRGGRGMQADAQFGPSGGGEQRPRGANAITLLAHSVLSNCRAERKIDPRNPHELRADKFGAGCGWGGGGAVAWPTKRARAPPAEAPIEDFRQYLSHGGNSCVSTRVYSSGESPS